MFQITGTAGTPTEDIDLTVSIVGSGDVTVTKLPTGQYTVKELSGWAWRYETAEAERMLELEYSENGTTLVFAHTREGLTWLDGNAASTNVFDAAE